MAIRLLIKSTSGLLLDDSIELNASSMELWQAESTLQRVLSEYGFPPGFTELKSLYEFNKYEEEEIEVPISNLCHNTPLHHFSKALVQIRYAS